jgi:hypothetical protein
MDDVIAVYKRDIDRTLLRESLKLTPLQRIERLGELLAFARQMRSAGKRAFGDPNELEAISDQEALLEEPERE